MNKLSMGVLVMEAVTLDREINEMQARLKALKGELIEHACQLPDAERAATDGGGWTAILRGNDGCVASVIAPAPKLRNSLDPEVKAHAKILDKFGDARKRVFDKRTVFVLIKDFRAAVEQEFPPAVAAKLIEACETQSEPRVAFETADRGQEIGDRRQETGVRS
jgi:hypothetical protein